jgi:AcrR family transcriptional regulator
MAMKQDPKKDKILETAFRLFLKHGYRKVTMGDLAAEAAMSRPSLYAVFPNKEAVLTEMIDRQREANKALIHTTLPELNDLKDQLHFIFDVWIIQPFASVVDSENGKELIVNCATFVPLAVDQLFADFEACLSLVLERSFQDPSKISAKDTARILNLATRGLKSSTDTLPQIKRLTDGLIAMTIAAVN